MKTANTTLKLLSLLVGNLILMNFQCDHCENRIYDQASYALSVSSIGPTFSIGDTIVVDTHFSSQIPLENSGLIHDNAGQYIRCNVAIFAGIPNTADAVQARDSFTFVDLEGKVFIPGGRTWEINLENTCGMTECGWSFGMVALKAGYYGLLLGGGVFDQRDYCQTYRLTPTEILHSQNGNNFFVFREIQVNSLRVNSSYFRYPEDEKKFYFFKVIE